MVFDIGNIKKEPLMQDPYVKEVYELACDKSLFYKSPEELKKKRRDLFRKSLDYFSRHDEDFYKPLLENLDIQPSTAELEDLVDIAVPSDRWRGTGQKKYWIKDVSDGGKTYRSSGTTGGDPVTVYRSPIDLAIERGIDGGHIDYVCGYEIDGGEALFFAAPELKETMGFVGGFSDLLESRGIDVKYGMKVEDVKGSRTIWEKMRPDRKSIASFYRSKKEPKYIISAPVGIYKMLRSFEEGGLSRKLIFKLFIGVPPINLGKGGTIFTGGGKKGADIPSIEKLMEMTKDKIIAKDKDGKKIPAPWIDVLGHTEHLGILPSKPNTLTKIPHPLTHTFLVDQKTFKPLKDYEEGVLGIFSPFYTTFLNAFYPGDIMESVPDDNYYGCGFVHKRRLSTKEGWSLQRACGAALEEGMKEKF